MSHPYRPLFCRVPMEIDKDERAVPFPPQANKRQTTSELVSYLFSHPEFNGLRGYLRGLRIYVDHHDYSDYARITAFDQSNGHIYSIKVNSMYIMQFADSPALIIESLVDSAKALDSKMWDMALEERNWKAMGDLLGRQGD